MIHVLSSFLRITALRPSVVWSLLPRSRILRQYLQAQTGAIGPRCASILTSCVELWICSPSHTFLAVRTGPTSLHPQFEDDELTLTSFLGWGMQSTSQLISYLTVMDELGGLFRVDLKLYPVSIGPRCVHGRAGMDRAWRIWPFWILGFVLGSILKSSLLFVGNSVRPVRHGLPRWAMEVSPEDMAQAKKEIAELEELVKANDADAQFRLGQVYRKGRFVEQDFTRAFELIFDAAQQEHVRAEHLLGMMLIRGEGCEKDEDTGCNFVLMAAEDGYPPAQFAMGKLYMTGLHPAGEDKLSGAYWLKRAAVDHVPAQLMLGELLLKGEGVKRNETLAAQYFMLAARKGSVEAQEIVGQLFRTGTGVPQDQALARGWLQKAADQGNEEACLTLASMYRKGEGSPRDPVAALKCLQQAAEKGNPEAANELGVMYLAGEGTFPDEALTVCPPLPPRTGSSAQWSWRKSAWQI
eukprot:s1312_g4.t1